MLLATATAPFGQTANLPAILAAADQGAAALAAFAQRLRQAGAPIDAEILRTAASVDLGELDENDPRVVRVDQLAIANRIHRPDLEGVSAGRFPIELDPFDSADLTAARDAIAAAISAVRAESAASVRKRLIDRNAFPQFGGGLTLVKEAVRIENLLDVYKSDVLGRGRLRGVHPGFIVGGIVIGLLGLGAIALATRSRA